MGAWIEIDIHHSEGIRRRWSHPTMGAWIEIFNDCERCKKMTGRTPRWVRGLKLSGVTDIRAYLGSHPTMGAWIEIFNDCDCITITFCRTPRWVRGLKLCAGRRRKADSWSHPTMGAWIEIKI